MHPRLTNTLTHLTQAHNRLHLASITTPTLHETPTTPRLGSRPPLPTHILDATHHTHTCLHELIGDIKTTIPNLPPVTPGATAHLIDWLCDNQEPITHHITWVEDLCDTLEDLCFVLDEATRNTYRAPATDTYHDAHIITHRIKHLGGKLAPSTLRKWASQGILTNTRKQGSKTLYNLHECLQVAAKRNII